MIRIKFKYIFVPIVFILFGINTFAQEKISLTVEQAVEIGLQNSKILHASLMKVKGAEAKVSEVNALRLPSIKMTAGYRRLSKVDPFSITTPFGTFDIAPAILDGYSLQFSIFQPVFTGFRLLGNSEMNEQLANATNEDFNKDRNELVFNIKNAYWSLFKANQFKKVMDETVDQIKAHVEDARNLEKVGMMTKNDILKIEVQLSNVMYQQVDAENVVRLSAIGLNNILSIPLNTVIEIKSSANLMNINLDELNFLVGNALEKRPEVKAADSRIKAGEAGVTMAKSSWYPQITISGNYYYNRPNSRIMPTRDQFDATWDAGVGLSLNIWDWLTTKHQTDQAEAQLAQAVDGIGIIKDGIVLEVTQNYLNVNQAKKRINISELTVKQAEENMRVTSAKFKNGIATTSEVVDAETALITARTNYTNSIVDFELAKARLDKSIGK